LIINKLITRSIMSLLVSLSYVVFLVVLKAMTETPVLAPFHAAWSKGDVQGEEPLKVGGDEYWE
jgi:hypothetical protein